MSSRYTKGIPEFIYMIGGDDETVWSEGPFIHPKKGRANRKFKLIEVPMDEPKAKKNENTTKK